MAESNSGSEPAKALAAEQRIGSYRILQPLGTGGMSSVFRAAHVDMGHEVALKVLTRSLARNSTLLQRFLREARSAETLQHPNIVTIFDRGIDRGRHYLVLEYVDGGDFHDYIQRRGPIDAAEAVSVIRDVAEGLSYAARQGLIHRDIKPSNILRSRTGQIKIIDLGLALQNEFEDERVTREGTTVGTVDYMAPEQARDSRATSIQSDIYSLGCTFFYLLTGSPPYAGGDITDKLTRHAKAPVPDVRTLNPGVPAAIAAIIMKMLAKLPEERFKSYEELVAALEASPLVGDADGLDDSAIPLADEIESAGEPDVPATRESAGRESREEQTSESESLELVSLAELADETPSGSRERPAMRLTLGGPSPVLKRQSRLLDDEAAAAAGPLAAEAASPPKAASSASVWIIAVMSLLVAVVLVTLGALQFMESSALPDDTATRRTVAGLDGEDSGAALTQARHLAANRGNRSSDRIGRVARATAPVFVPPPPRWIEPVDTDLDENSVDVHLKETNESRSSLPEWARAPIPARIDGPFVEVRRIVEPSDATTIRSLRRALDTVIGGTVELADEGPFFIDDLRVAGETRLVRARSGYRPIVRVVRSSLDAVRKRAAIFELDGKDLTLDGIDLVVDVRDLALKQTALFSCSGGTLTLNNCSLTILNYNNAAFTVVRVEDPKLRPSRVRIERTLIRGHFGTGFDIVSSPVELVLRNSVVAGIPNALIRTTASSVPLEQSFCFSDSVLAGFGPIIESINKNPTPGARPIRIRAFGSVFSRFHGAGIASVISSSSAATPAAKQIEWAGDKNLFVGWKGFFASGSDLTITVGDLGEIRSTWNGVERESHEILAPWPFPTDVSAISADDLAPFVPNRDSILRRVAHPRPGFFPKAVGAYPTPEVPQTGSGIVERRTDSRNRARFGGPARAPLTAEGDAAGTQRAAQTRPAGPSPGDGEDLTFQTDALPWNGDLGAFLKDRLTPGTKRASVHVLGAGPQRFSPVRLPDGLWLEIHVEPLAAAEPPSWSPQADASGPALIALKGGVLVLSNMILKHEDAPHLEHLIDVESGHLVAARSQFLAIGTNAPSPRDLISFRSPTTQPIFDNRKDSVFSIPVDRPVCRLEECVLITDGTALKAELGRGLVALSDCAMAAGVADLALFPSLVSRHRFEADLIMDRCTLASERSIVQFGPWPGKTRGPDRPWLITSRHCAFVAMYDRRSRETVLLRCDSDAMARGALTWQATSDAVDVDFFIAAGAATPPENRIRDFVSQWVYFWGSNHISGRLTGPRGAGNLLSVRLYDRLRPGRIEPVDLLLNPDYHPERDQLNVGADLRGLGIVPRSNRFGKPSG